MLSKITVFHLTLINRSGFKPGAFLMRTRSTLTS